MCLILLSRFQAVSAAYKVLSDSEKRAVYDESGEVDDEDVLDKDRDWDQYWRLLFKARPTDFTCTYVYSTSTQ